MYHYRYGIFSESVSVLNQYSKLKIRTIYYFFTLRTDSPNLDSRQNTKIVVIGHGILPRRYP